jgi:hypothetical protein
LTDIAAFLEATALAQHLRASQWTYPIVNAGHIFGIALLVGAVVPLDCVASGLIRGHDPARIAALLRPFAVVGLIVAATCGGLLFITQATDYIGNSVFLAKMALFALAVANAALHLAFPRLLAPVLALISLALWPAILILGRMVAYVIN